MPGIGIITNPHSRRNRRFPEQMRRLGYILGQHDTYKMTDRVEDVTGVAEDFKRNDIEILALNGGDGTNHVTLTRLIEVYGDHPLPKIALLRGGTMNTVSNGVGIKGRPSRLLANLVEKYYTGQPFETTERDMLKVSDETGTRYGFIFGNGIISNFLDLYYGTGHPSPSTAAFLMAKAIITLPLGGEIVKSLFRPFRAQVEIDADTWPLQEYTAVIAATVEQIGLGFRPFIRCEERPCSFHLLGVTANAVELVAELPRIRLGRAVPDSKIRSAVTSRAHFEAHEPFSYTIDGDMHTSKLGQVTLENGPRVEIILK